MHINSMTTNIKDIICLKEYKEVYICFISLFFQGYIYADLVIYVRAYFCTHPLSRFLKKKKKTNDL